MLWEMGDELLELIKSLEFGVFGELVFSDFGVVVARKILRVFRFSATV